MSCFRLGLSVRNSPLSLSSAPLAELCGSLEFRLASSHTVGARLPPPFALDRFFRRDSSTDACTGATMLCDIGNGTMNIMTITNGKPNAQKCFTEKYGTHQCFLAVREEMLRKFGSVVDDDIIEDVLRNGKTDISDRYLSVIRETAGQYVAGIMRRLREHEYNPELMKLYIVGGGGCLISNFGDYDPNRVTINSDICATAKGYEFLAELRLKKAETK